MANLPDFSFRPQQSPLELARFKAQQEQQQIENQRNKDNDNLNRIEKIGGMASSLAQQMVKAAADRQSKNIVDQSLAILGKPKPVADPSPVNQIFDRGPVNAPSNLQPKEMPNMSLSPAKPSPMQEQLDAKYDADRKNAKMQLARYLNPEALGKQFANEAVPSAPDQASKRYQQGTADVNGQIEAVIFDTMDGKFLHSDHTPMDGRVIRGFKPDLRTDPETEQTIRITSGNTVTPIISPSAPKPNTEINDPLDLNVRQSNRLNELRKNFEDDDNVKSNRITLNTVNNLKTVQAEGSAALIGSLQSLRARGIAGEKGVLTEQDVLRTTGSPQLTRRFMNAFTKLALGKENPENLAEFNSAIEAVEEAASSRNARIEKDFVNRAKRSKELSSVSEQLIKDNIGIGTSPFAVQKKPKAPSGPSDLGAALRQILPKR